MIFRVSCGNPESRQGTVLGLGIVEGWLGTWVAPVLLAVSGSWNSLASDKEFTLFCYSWIWVKSWLTVAGPLFWCMFNSSILARLPRSVSGWQILLNSSISWQSFAWFSRKSQFLISTSPHNFIFSLWADQLIDSPVVAAIVGIRVLDESHKEQ